MLMGIWSGAIMNKAAMNIHIYIMSYIHICVCIYIYIYIFYSGLSQDIEYSSLCYTKDLIVCLLYNYVKFKNNKK